MALKKRYVNFNRHSHRSFDSIPIILNLLTNRNIALIYSVTIWNQKQRIVHGHVRITRTSVNKSSILL